MYDKKIKIKFRKTLLETICNRKQFCGRVDLLVGVENDGKF